MAILCCLCPGPSVTLPERARKQPLQLRACEEFPTKHPLQNLEAAHFEFEQSAGGGQWPAAQYTGWQCYAVQSGEHQGQV